MEFRLRKNNRITSLHMRPYLGIQQHLVNHEKYNTVKSPSSEIHIFTPLNSKMYMIQRILFALLFIGASMSFTACNQCIGPFGKEKIVCDNGGTCNEGECDCLKGYSGETCSEVDLCELNDVVCAYGDCVEGDCICIDGYEGEFCEIETRVPLLGKYQIREGCVDVDTLVSTYEMIIERDNRSDDQIVMTNVFNYSQWDLRGFFSPVQARVNAGTTSFNIYNQSPDDNAKVISGTGSLDLSDTTQITITIDYTVVDGNKTYSCQLTGVKTE